jgi:hypothetical protein
MWEDIRTILGIVIMCIALFMGVGVPVTGLLAYQENAVCKELRIRDEAHRYEWTFWTGCRVQTSEGYWIHYQDAGIIHLTSEE